MRAIRRYSVLAMTLAFVPLGCTGAAQTQQVPEQRLIQALVDRADRLLQQSSDKKVNAAYWSLYFASKFAPSRADIASKFKSLEGGPAMTSAQVDQISRAIQESYSDDVQNFGSSTPQMVTANLRMLMEATLTGDNTFSRSKSSTFEYCVFATKPTATIQQVRDQFGAPSLETVNKDKQALLNYGRFRVLGGNEGAVLAVVFACFP